MKCVRELFKEQHQNNKQLFPLISKKTTLASLQYRGDSFSELDSFLLRQETFDDFIPELILPPYYEAFRETTPIKQEKEEETSCHYWMEPLSVDITSETSLKMSKTVSKNRVTPSKCLLKIAPKNYQNQRLPDKMKQSVSSTEAEKGNKLTRGYPYVPRKIARRKRTIFSPMQVAYLEERFRLSRYMDSREAARHGPFLGIAPDTILVWFQNRRARQRRKEIAEQRMSNKTVTITPANSDSVLRQPDLPSVS